MPRQQELKIEKIVTWMSGKLALLVCKKGTWAARVGNGEDGVFDISRVGPLILEEEDLVSKSW